MKSRRLLAGLGMSATAAILLAGCQIAGGWGDGWSSSIRQMTDDPRVKGSAWAKWEGEHHA